jgi:hypothetical protein
MFVDIVCPKKNEKEFIRMAEKLGIEGVCFLYRSSSDFQRIRKLKSQMPLFAASFQKRRSSMIVRLSGKEVFFDIDTTKQQPALFGFSFSSLSSSKNFPARIAVIRKSVRLCRKTSGFLIASLAKSPSLMRSRHELLSLFVCLGMTPGEAKRAINLTGEILSGRKKYDGIEILH